MATADITIKGKDETSAAVKSARQNLQNLREEKKRLTDQTKLATASFGQFGNLASTLGQTQLAGLINQVENLTTSKLKLTEALKQSKTAMAAISVAAVATGWSIGEAVRKYIPFFNEVDKLEKSASIAERITAVSNARLTVRDPIAGAAAAQRNETASQIDKLQNQFGAFNIRKTPTKEEQELIFQLQQLQDERELKAEGEKHQASNRLLQDAINERYRMESDHLGSIQTEKARFEQQQIDLQKNTQIDETTRQGIAEQNYRVHQLKLASIHQDRMDREVAAERAKFAIQQQIAAGVSGIFGNLAAAAQASGAKGFAAFKAFAMAQAIIDTYRAANAAYAAMAGIPFVGPALGVAAAAAAVAAGLANVAQIAQAKPYGQAHSGMDYVPKEASYTLQRGEMVLDPGTSEEVREAAAGRAGGGRGGDLYLDGEKVGRVLWNMSRNGRLRIAGGAIV